MMNELFGVVTMTDMYVNWCLWRTDAMNANEPHSNVEGKMFTEPLKKTYNSKLEILLFVFAITPSRALSCVCIDVYVCGSAWNHYSVLVPFVNVVLSIQALIETTCASAFRTHVYTRHGYFSNGLLVRVCICDSPTIFHDRLSRVSLYSCSDTQIDSKSLYTVSFPMEILHCVNICVLVASHRRRVTLRFKWFTSNSSFTTVIKKCGKCARQGKPHAKGNREGIFVMDSDCEKQAEQMIQCAYSYRES